MEPVFALTIFGAVILFAFIIIISTIVICIIGVSTIKPPEEEEKD